MIRSSVPQLMPCVVETYEDGYHRISYPIDAQPKLDGWRAVASWDGDDIFLCSRSGERLRIAHIEKALRAFLPHDVVLDGEIWAPGMALDNIGSLIRRPCPSSAMLTYAIFDMPVFGGCLDMPWRNRLHALRQTASKALPPPGLTLVPTTTCATSGEASDLFSHLTNMGHEGIILRIPSARYGEVGSVLKRKNFSDAEFPVVGVDRRSALAVIRLGTSAGEIAVTTSRALAHGLRHGDTVTVSYCGFTASGLPREPRYRARRDAADMRRQ